MPKVFRAGSNGKVHKKSILADFDMIYFIGILILLITAFALLPQAFEVLLTGSTITKVFDFNPLFGPVDFVFDPLSAFFAVIILIMSPLALIYAKGYLKPYQDKGKSINSHVALFVTLALSMLAVVTCQNALGFLICWEIMSLSSFFLVIFENEKKEILNAGVKYLVFMHISVIFIIIAFAMMSIKAGSYDFSAFSMVLANNPHFRDVVFLLALIGFGVKAGFVPFHNWLPEAHPAAPSHVSAIMSGVMIKTGIYGILRILSLGGCPSKALCYAVLGISIITFLYGILYAIGQNDVKKMLAYSSIENIGIIGSGLGVSLIGIAYNQPVVALLGLAGGILHILNHSIFKLLLFFGAGCVYLKTHTRDMEILGGLVKNMPKTAGLFLAASLAICALPPFNGLISEFLIYFGMLKALSIKSFFAFLILIFAVSSLAFVGTMAILCFTKAFSVIFLGNPRGENASAVKEDAPLTMLCPMGALAAFALGIGLLPEIILKTLLWPVITVIGNWHGIGFKHALTPETLSDMLSQQSTILSTLGFTAFGLVLLILIFAILKKALNRKVESASTWGCGYNRTLLNAQYTGSSYVSPFLAMLKPLFKKVFDVKKPKEIFPKSAHFSLHIEDIEEAYVISPMVKFDEWFLSKFEKMQGGNLQTYIKYGLAFLILLIIGSFLIG